jgi:D-amino peptidase
MKIYMVADMEGATGITHRDQLMETGGKRYWDGCELLTGDVNAVIEGVVSEGATEVLVSEGHACMRNILVSELHPAGRVLRGPARWDVKPLCQVGALGDDVDLGVLVGFHSRAGTPGGLLCHTWSGAVVHRFAINGVEVGETAINAALLGAKGVPVGLVCGGDDLAREARADLGDVECAITKEVLGFDLAVCPGPKKTLPLLREAAALAVRRHREGAFTPYVVQGPVTITLDVMSDAQASRMALTEGIERTERRQVLCQAAEVTDALSLAWRAIQEVFHTPDSWLK